MYTYEIVDTPDGPFIVVEGAVVERHAGPVVDGAVLENGAVVENSAVVAAGWSDDASQIAARAKIPADSLERGPLASADAVRAWYAGDASALDGVRVEQSGTDFQARVWAALRRIPRGHVRRYGEVAAELGSPGASRAVGAACGRNALALFVPCHRVVGASGALTGFAWGVDVKRSLLERERR